jgi:glycosyltransferase involved in cell wall biosynthesis
MNPLISICIPTWNRPDFLQEALESCFIQDYRPIEIVIGDDSSEDDTEMLIKAIKRKNNFTIKYIRNRSALGQAGNVNLLFEIAEGERIVLLHDDDLLLPNAISQLASCWSLYPNLTATFGKQQIISESGEVLPDDSDGLNQAYYRTSEWAGLQKSSLASALLQQFPNDGYMILASAAKSVRYRDEAEVGTNRWCDFDFGIRLALKYNNFYFLNKYIAKYRLTSHSVSKSGKPVYMYPLIKSLDIPPSDNWAKDIALARLAPIVLHNYAALGNKSEAWGVYLSPHYSLSRKFSLPGLYHLALISLPQFLTAKIA